MIAELLEALSLGHWVAEVIMEIVSYLVIGRLFLRWHDRKKHPKLTTTSVADSLLTEYVRNVVQEEMRPRYREKGYL